MGSRISTREYEKQRALDAMMGTDKPLTRDQIETIYETWRPDAKYDVGAAGAFFTPLDLAKDVMLFMNGADDGKRCIDLCAGIGGLTWAMKYRHDDSAMHYVAVEINPAFVEIGKRLQPDVEWICASVLDQDEIANLGRFDIAYSNPPFGRVRTTKGGEWLNYTGSADLMVCEIIARITTGYAMVILPASSVPWGDNRRDHDPKGNYSKWAKANPGLELRQTSVFSGLYEFVGVNVKYEIAEIAWANSEGLYPPVAAQMEPVFTETDTGQLVMF